MRYVKSLENFDHSLFNTAMRHISLRPTAERTQYAVRLLHYCFYDIIFQDEDCLKEAEFLVDILQNGHTWANEVFLGCFLAATDRDSCEKCLGRVGVSDIHKEKICLCSKCTTLLKKI